MDGLHSSHSDKWGVLFCQLSKQPKVNQIRSNAYNQLQLIPVPEVGGYNVLFVAAKVIALKCTGD